MKHFILVCWVVGAVVFFSGCQDNGVVPADQPLLSLEKPSPILVGWGEVIFTWTPPTFFNGTITFGGDEYGLTYISLVPPRDFSAANIFAEEVLIYELGNQGNVYLHGEHSGVSITKFIDQRPVDFVNTGKVLEASGPFEGWQGRNYFSEGTISWDLTTGLPTGAEGIMRLN